ncbi:MAG: hypothetical protein GX555_01545 [Actinomycetales bacterium]|nr:hypothetical protein [Actinomycetales bacterium]
MIADVTDDQRVQRRGRIVIVAIIALFLLACAALGVFLWQRQQHEAQLDALRRTGLLSVGAPDWGYPIHSVEPLEDNVGLEIRYADDDGEPMTGVRALNLRAGTDADLCALLARAEPAFAEPDSCEVDGLRLSASLDGPTTILNAEGELRAATLVVLVAHPAEMTAEEMGVWVSTTNLTTVEGLLDRVG